MNLFFVAGIGVAVFIEFLLLGKKRKSISDKILTVWMFLIIVHLFLFTLFFTGDISRVPFLLGAEHPLPLLHGVFLYYYVASVTEQLPGRRWMLLLHLLPAALMYAYLISFFSLPADEKIAVYRNKGAGYELFSLVKLYAITISGVAYVIVSIVLLRKHRKTIRDSFSDLERVGLRWLQILTYGLGGIWFLVLFFGNEPLIFTGVVTFIFLIGFFGVRQGDIFTHGRQGADAAPPADEGGEPEREIQDWDGATEEQRKKYTKSGLGTEAAAELHTALIALMVEKERYKKSDLSIDDLAAELRVHPNHLSQVINQKEGKNFYDFVNSYRIAAFKRLIEANKNRQYTLLSLAFDCGFSSKSSFNRCFKKETGQTPSEFSASLPGERQ
jgi:AraC-like DNA-binding protein